MPLENASLLHSAHQGALSALTAFHRLRSDQADHTAGSCSPACVPWSNACLICATAQLCANRRAPSSRRNPTACCGEGTSATVQPLTMAPGGAAYLPTGGL